MTFAAGPFAAIDFETARADRGTACAMAVAVPGAAGPETRVWVRRRRGLWMSLLSVLVALTVACAAAEESDDLGLAICDVSLSDLTDALAEIGRLANEWDSYAVEAATGLLTDDELWDLWNLVYKDLITEDWYVRDAIASVDRDCVFEDQEAWEQEAQALRAASHELNSGLRPLCPVLFATIMENSVYGDSVDACALVHSYWPYPA